ncbi:N-acetylmuramoyl-L-alanine amidase [Vibrio alginolyticus]|uniref:N-acetylmuramoyl-L-alanine amidase n=1 Tax=Vibrio alginolyticus TaxID=663 RepID=UPI002160EE1A|nr:N-acetylmuramoyl-L-alanine amidase [Vibrio alginolyticus]MCS0255816.1 N-acetylmuramoyl-L-alanine amidase [Vibrio alginolyticus]
MKKVCIVVGHSCKDGGAYNETFGINEYGYNHPLASLLATELHKRDILPVIMYRDTYSRMIGDVNESGADYAIELHCNSVANKSVQGSETLHWHKSDKSQALAQRLQKAVAGLIGQRDRGLKPISNTGTDTRGWRFLMKTKMPAVILEPFFLSNDESLQKGLELREKLAVALAEAFAEHIKESN